MRRERGLGEEEMRMEGWREEGKSEGWGALGMLAGVVVSDNGSNPVYVEERLLNRLGLMCSIVSVDCRGDQNRNDES